MGKITEYIVFIGIGSNLGDRIENIQKAIEKIDNDSFSSVLNISSFYESKAFGNIEQSDFINAVIKISTQYLPEQLYLMLKNIETEIGRVKTVKWGPRKIDLDILFFNDWIYDNNNLKIPHEGIPERDFVLMPMAEIEPDFVHPEINKKISDICTSVKIKTVKNKLTFESLTK